MTRDPRDIRVAYSVARPPVHATPGIDAAIRRKMIEVHKAEHARVEGKPGG